VPGRAADPVFQLYTVAATAAPITASGGMTIIPNYTFANAPAPKVIVIPAQNARDPAVLTWIREATRTADLTMSVCTGAFLLARTGLLNGKAATTHHGSFNEFAMQFPNARSSAARATWKWVTSPVPAACPLALTSLCA